MKRVLVKFNNGKFGVRIGRWPRYRFQDLACQEYAWKSPKFVIKYCQGDEETAREALVDPIGHEVVRADVQRAADPKETK